MILRTKALFEQEGMPGFDGLLLRLFDKQVIRRLLAGTVVPGVPTCGCGHARWELCAVEPRRLRTSIGTVPLQWWRLRCPACGHERHPDGLGHLAEECSRCHWHQIHDLYDVMSQESGAFTRKQRRRYQKKLAGILEIVLPAEDFEQVAWDDKVEIASRMYEAAAKLDALIATFRKKQCQEAARYLDYAKGQFFGYVREWLEYGIVSPRATSLIVRLIRELGRRLKKIAFGWSEAHGGEDRPHHYQTGDVGA